MNLHLLARQRAQLAARLEALSTLGPSRDKDEQREIQIALAQAEREYRLLEQRFARATATLTVAEMAEQGIKI